MNWLRGMHASTLLKAGLYGLLGILLLSYALFQARSLIRGPVLSVDELPVVHETATTMVSGVATNISALTLNGRPILTDETGRFRELVVLEQGYTIMTLRGTDRYGREATYTRPLVYAPAFE